MQRFEEKWVAHVDCEELIRTSWTETQPRGSPMYCLFEKIKKCRHDLVQWSRNAFGDTRTKLGAKQQELQDLSTTDYAHNLDRINLVRREVNDLLNHEEVFW